MSELKPCATDRERAIAWFENLLLSEHMMNEEAAGAIKEAIKALRRAQPANEPLTLEELRGMDNERVFVRLDDDVCIPALIAYNTEDCSNEDEEDTVYLTNNLGGRSTYEDMLDMGARFYRRKPEPEGSNPK